MCVNIDERLLCRLRLRPSSYKSPADQVGRVQRKLTSKETCQLTENVFWPAGICRTCVILGCGDSSWVCARTDLTEDLELGPFNDDFCHAAACGDALDLLRLHCHVWGRWKPQRKRRQLGAKLLRLQWKTQKDFRQTGRRFSDCHQTEERC